MPVPAAADLPGADSLRVLHADEDWIVIDKPAGLPSVPGRAPGLDDCAASRAQSLFADALVVHRLDMATSGLLLMARGAAAQRRLSEAFAQRRVDKRYLALVEGELQGEQGEIDLPLAADWPRRPLQKVDILQGKASLTRWQVLSHEAGVTRVGLQPLTGRSHQLRLHLAAIGHPILGDTLYAPPAVQAMSTRLMLHASQLTLAHPRTGTQHHFQSPAPF